MPTPNRIGPVLPARNATGESAPNEDPTPKCVPSKSGRAGGGPPAGGGVASWAYADAVNAQRTSATATMRTQHRNNAAIAASLMCGIRTSVRLRTCQYRRVLECVNQVPLQGGSVCRSTVFPQTHNVGCDRVATHVIVRDSSAWAVPTRCDS